MGEVKTFVIAASVSARAETYGSLAKSWVELGEEPHSCADLLYICMYL